ncbi:TetR/AcrR family transcriptional regulator [Bacillus niameyensis]|uniref:TetR/AcrR family transcriptional regulator n=1 Tax=Bacillus niameyensis TaxID=1522308 RepID=UPI0007830A23|nr:TetR/AcrR family transcriptional regulator [Bacillus niameyensis]
MPPKKKFSKQQIVEAAFEIAKEEGMSNITIRKVAERLGSSIAPIYVNFNNVEELISEVMKKIIELSHQLIEEVDSGQPFHDIGVASLRFARDYPVLFRDFVMKQNDYIQNYDQDMGHDLIKKMQEDSDLQGLSNEELKTVFLKMRIFTTGLSVMIANGMLTEEFNEQMGIDLLNSMATDVISSAYLRKNDI